MGCQTKESPFPSPVGQKEFKIIQMYFLNLQYRRSESPNVKHKVLHAFTVSQWLLWGEHAISTWNHLPHPHPPDPNKTTQYSLLTELDDDSRCWMQWNVCQEREELMNDFLYLFAMSSAYHLLFVLIAMHGNYNAGNNVQHVTAIGKFKKGAFVTLVCTSGSIIAATRLI